MKSGILWMKEVIKTGKRGEPCGPKSMCPTKLLLPKHHTQVGRPKKKRRQSEGEKLSKSQRGSQGATQEAGFTLGADGVKKLSRKHVSVTCGKCKNKGHNSRTCKGKGQGGRQTRT
ncbi:hypothetical protein LXL04_009581 [Taraxacum kok-saghyz]